MPRLPPSCLQQSSLPYLLPLPRSWLRCLPRSMSKLISPSPSNLIHPTTPPGVNSFSPLSASSVRYLSHRWHTGTRRSRCLVVGDRLLHLLPGILLIIIPCDAPAHGDRHLHPHHLDQGGQPLPWQQGVSCHDSWGQIPRSVLGRFVGAWVTQRLKDLADGAR